MHRRSLSLLALLLLGAPSQASADSGSGSRRISIEFTTLKLMREKGLITDAEMDSALRDLADTVGNQAIESTSLAIGKWSTTIYGMVEADNIYDTTESFNDFAGNALVQRPGTYAGNHGRFTTGVRNSRLGFRLRAPEFHHVRTSALLEMDFLGNQAAVGYNQAYQISENAFFTSPVFRIRHYMLKLETPIVDILIGQYWHLFGWQSQYHPNTVEIQGVVGQVYSRTPQIRVSKAIRTKPITIELALAMMRAPQRDSSTPEGQAGVRLVVTGLRGKQTIGASGSVESPLSFAVTADVRHFSLPELAARPVNSVDKTGWGVAADAFIPVIPLKLLNKFGNLAFNGEYAWGYGIADLYTGLNNGVANAALPNPMMTMPAPTYTIDADPSLVVFAADGSAHLIQIQSYMVGMQYYLPKLDGRLWVSANYMNVSSNNARLHPNGAFARLSEDRADVNFFADVTPAVRLSVAYIHYLDHYSDGVDAPNHRVQFSAFYLF